GAFDYTAPDGGGGGGGGGGGSGGGVVSRGDGSSGGGSDSGGGDGGSSIPGAPINLANAVFGANVTLTWGAPTSGAPASSYVIEAGSLASRRHQAVLCD